jgi:hypothetical protein
MRNRHVIAAALFSVGASAAAALAADLPRYTMTRIEAPPVFEPRDFNARGDTVGFKRRTWEPTVYPEHSGYRQLARSEPRVYLDAPSEWEFGMLRAINDSGLAVGQVQADPVQVKPGTWTDGIRVDVVMPDGQRLDLTPLLPEGADSWAVDVNNRGEVAGNVIVYGGWLAGRICKPFIWTEAAGMEFPLGLDADDRKSMQVTTINEAGQLAGRSRDYSYGEVKVWDRERGFAWSHREVWSVADMNVHGEVVGETTRNDAYVWTVGGGKFRLPPPKGRPKAACMATAINDAGTIVGACAGEAVAWVPGEDRRDYKIVDLWKQVDLPPDAPIWRYPKGERPLPLRIHNDGSILMSFDAWGWVPPWSEEPKFSVILTPKP